MFWITWHTNYLIMFKFKGFLGTFVKVPWPGDSEVTLRFLSQAAICYYQSNHLKVEAVLLSALPKGQKANLPAYLHSNPFKCWMSSR